MYDTKLSTKGRKNDASNHILLVYFCKKCRVFVCRKYYSLNKGLYVAVTSQWKKWMVHTNYFQLVYSSFSVWGRIFGRGGRQRPAVIQFLLVYWHVWDWIEPWWAHNKWTAMPHSFLSWFCFCLEWVYHANAWCCFENLVEIGLSVEQLQLKISLFILKRKKIKKLKSVFPWHWFDTTTLLLQPQVYVHVCMYFLLAQRKSQSQLQWEQ